MPEPKPEPSADDTKRKFREALERKKQAQQNRPGHLDAGSAVQSTHGKAGGKREFRRKSG
jgi:hypothetical protein